MSEPAGYFTQPPFDKPRNSSVTLKMIALLLFVFICAGIVIVIILALLGPIIGNIFSSAMPEVVNEGTVPIWFFLTGLRVV